MKVSTLLKLLTDCPQTSDVYATPSDDVLDGEQLVENILMVLSNDKRVLITYEN